MATIGFVGLGMMGSRMVTRLMEAGHKVTGYNRSHSRAEPLIEQGMTWADSPREAAQGAEIIFTNVRDDEALRAVTQGDDGILAGLAVDQIYIDMSTVNPNLSRDLAEQCSEKGAYLLDAPVSGSKLTLEQGKLAIMVSGDAGAFERAKPILEAIGPTVMYVGSESGQAMALKLAINISIVTQVVSFAEGVLLAERYGLAPAKAVEIMLNSAIASPALKYRGPFVAQMPDEAWFDVEMTYKDIALALELGGGLGVELPTATVAHDLLLAARNLGWSDKDFAILYEVLKEKGQG